MRVYVGSIHYGRTLVVTLLCGLSIFRGGSGVHFPGNKRAVDRCGAYPTLRRNGRHFLGLGLYSYVGQ